MIQDLEIPIKEKSESNSSKSDKTPQEKKDNKAKAKNAPTKPKQNKSGVKKQINYTNSVKKDHLKSKTKSNEKAIKKASTIQSNVNQDKEEGMNKRFSYLLNKVQKKNQDFKKDLEKKNFESIAQDFISSNKNKPTHQSFSPVKDVKSNRNLYDTLNRAKRTGNVESEDNGQEKYQTM